MQISYYFVLFVFSVIRSGASEMLMANAVSQLAAKTPGKEAAAMEAFAAALRQVNSDHRISAGKCLTRIFF